MALRTTSSDAPCDTACEDATTPARTQTKEPKYQAGVGGACGGGRRLSSRNTGGDQEEQVAQVERLADAVVQQRQEDQAHVDQPARQHHEEIVHE